MAPSPGQTRTIPDKGDTTLLPTAGLIPGTIFAQRYQAIEELGTGGMGRVYRVLDLRLGEEVALKLIRPEAAADRGVIGRFASELKLARQIVHRNVARMFDLNEADGVPYITMEYVRGENLKRLIRQVGRLSPSQAVPIAAQICEGLAEAHRLGILHRDLKPHNILIDEDGQAKILDFGLARLLGQMGTDKRGSYSGTPAYVSPEQIRGLAADVRSDIYSLGVLMYEMLTGRTPFRADNVDEILDMHVRDVPKAPHALDPGLSAALSDLIMKCLEKDPADRYQSAEELGQALAELVAAPRQRKARRLRRILLFAGAPLALLAAGVLAFVVLGGRPWSPWLAVLPVEAAGLEEGRADPMSGLQEAVTDRLYDIPDLHVVPFLSVNSADLRGKSIPQMGRMLGARYLLRLKVAVAGGIVDARIQLHDATRNEIVASLSYAKELADYRAIQDEIARLTATALGVDLNAERLKIVNRRGTESIEAYGLFLEGMKALDAQASLANARRAIDLFSRAVEIDPDYALGHFGLGYAYENLYYEGKDHKDPAALEEMYEHLDRASRLDPSFAETSLGLGWYHFNKGDNALAFASFRKALDLEPNGYIVNRDAGAFLRSIGLYEQAITLLKRAADLSPSDPLPLVQIAQCWLYLGRCEKALLYTKKALGLREGDRDASLMHTTLLALTDRLEEAERQIKAMERFDFGIERLPLIKEYLEALREGRGRRHVFRSEPPPVSPQGTYMYLSLGMTAEALANIREGIDAGFLNGMYLFSYPSLAKNPWYKPLRGDPRFQDILKRQKDHYNKTLKPFEKL